jgi:hypothetical protein
MTQSELNREVASITGESIATISRLLLVGKRAPYLNRPRIRVKTTCGRQVPIEGVPHGDFRRHSPPLAAALRP